MSKKQKSEDREFALNYFRTFFPVGSTLYTVVVNVSRSGMARTIKLIGARDSGLDCLSVLASRVLDWPMARDGSGVRIHGAGMDMGFYLVYSLGRAVHGPLPYAYQHRRL